MDGGREGEVFSGHLKKLIIFSRPQTLKNAPPFKMWGQKNLGLSFFGSVYVSADGLVFG
jgi:hypothetical protein